jgi:hypothetical protein
MNYVLSISNAVLASWLKKKKTSLTFGFSSLQSISPFSNTRAISSPRNGADLDTFRIKKNKTDVIWLFSMGVKLGRSY